MHKLSFLVFVGTLALSVSGCNPGGGGGETASSPSPTTNNTPAAQTPAKQDFPGAVVPGKPATANGTKTPSTTALAPAPPSDLIPSTDPKARLGGLQKGVTDPFAQPPIQLEENKPQAITPNGNQKPVPNVRRIPGTESTPGVKVPTSVGQRGTAQVGGRQTTPRFATPPRPRIPRAVEVETPNRPQAPEPFALQPPSRLRVRPLSGSTAAPNRPQAGEPFTLIPSRGFVARNRTSTPGRFATQPSRRNVTRTTVAAQPQRRATSSQTTARTPIARARAIARTASQTPVARRTAVARATQSTPARRTAAVARTTQRQPARTTAIARAPQRTPARTAVARSTPSRTTAAANATPNPATIATPSATPTTPPEPQIPALPPPPEPTLARAVEVSGVVQVGNEPQAIIKAPNEATSRYVKVGQRLSQGQVLVKRIEMNDGSEPVVILEENGIEVAKMVGDRPAAPAQPGSQPGTPAAAVSILFAAGGMAIARSLSRQTGV